MQKKIKASLFQKRFWLEWLLNKSSTQYNTPLIFSIDGDLSNDALYFALDYFVNEHDIGCRGVFCEEQGELYQIIRHRVDVVIESIIVEKGAVKAELKKNLQRAFDLENGPLFYFVRLEVQGGPDLLLLSFHHIITDAKSAIYFIQAFQNLYQHYVEKSSLGLISKGCVPQEYTVNAQHTAYWCQLLEGSPLSVDLPKQVYAPGLYDGGRVYFELGEHVLQHMKHFCRETRSTFFILLSAVFSILLSMYVDKKKIILNYPVDSRSKEDKDNLGCFVNNFILMIDVQNNSTLKEVINSIKSQRKNTKQYMETTLTEVQRQMCVGSGMDISQPFNISIVEAFFDNTAISLPGVNLVPVDIEYQEIIGDMVFAYQVGNKGVRCRFDYNASKFSREFVTYFTKHFENLIEILMLGAEDPLRTLQEKSIRIIQTTPKEKSENYVDAAHETVLDAFFEQVSAHPSKLAIQCGNDALTYQQLDDRSSLLAANIIDQYDVDDSRVIAVLLNRSINLPIALLAILKLNKAYLPLHPKQPQRQITSIISESGVKLILTSSVLESKIKDLNVEKHLVDGRAAKHQQKNETIRAPLASDLAYVLYTSGSTGRPKGVMIEHHSLLNLIESFKAKLGVDKSEKVVSTTAYIFDIFGLELYLPLVSGATLFLLTEEELENVSSINAVLSRYKPTLMQGTPSFWQMIETTKWKGEERLRILCGGESLTPKIAEYLLTISQQVYQVYGPTETTIWSTLHELKSKDEYNIIGSPIFNTAVCVLDKNHKLVPDFVEGDLYINGVGLARGYYNNIELTEKFFITINTLFDSKTRWYYTGDRVYSNNNHLVYIGRVDQQVKIRGHRVDISAVENSINNIEGVKQAVVKADTLNGDLVLIAFVMLRKPSIVAVDDVKIRLREHLPSYMIPSFFVEKEVFELTQTGKVDRKKLKYSPKLCHSPVSNEPLANNERRMLQLWQKLLNTEVVGVDDNFFELGGHSIIAARLIMNIADEFYVNITMETIRAYSTIRLLCKYVQSLKRIPKCTKKMSDKVGKAFPLSDQQKDIYFSLQKNASRPDRFNQVVVQKLSGNLDIDSLSCAINEVVKFHPMLRAKVLVENEGQLSQMIMPFEKFSIPVKPILLSDLHICLKNEARYIFDLTSPPYFRMTVFQLSSAQHFLIFVAHHLIIDGWSINELNSLISDLYNKKTSMELLGNTYDEYVQEQVEFFTSNSYRGALDFWQNYLAEAKEAQFITDSARKTELLNDSQHIEFGLTSQTSEKIKMLAMSGNVTVFSVLVSALAITLYHYTSESDLIVWSPVANRNSSSVANLVGLLTRLIPFKIRFDADDDLKSVARKVYENISMALEHQEVAHQDLLRLTQKDVSSFKGMQVVFSLQNANSSYQLSLNNIKSEYVSVFNGASEYNMHFNLYDLGGTYSGALSYQTDLYTRESMYYLVKHFESLLENFSSEGMPVVDMPILTRSEDWISKGGPGLSSRMATKQCSILDVFYDQVLKNADNVAVSDEYGVLTYAQLDEQSTKLACHLKSQYQAVYSDEMPRSCFVGIFLDRTNEYVIALLAVLKASAAYVPLEPRAPLERTQFILEDSGVKFLITSHSYEDTLSSCGMGQYSLIFVDDEIPIYRDCSLSPALPEEVAYVIYTSGTTGRPKGSVISHQNVMRLIDVSSPVFNFSNKDIWCQFHSFSFDFSIWEIFGALLTGAHVSIVPYYVSRDPELFRTWLSTKSITILSQTPTAFGQLVEVETLRSDILVLRYVIFGGEAIKLGVLKQWWNKYSDDAPQLVNMYGITETTVHVTYKFLSTDNLVYETENNIGVPLSDLRAYVVNRRGQLCGVGMPGELYIAGAGLSKGYLNQEGLTKSKFLPGSEIRVDEDCVFKTGDRVRWLASGELSYLGRCDSQIKLRGFRIQPEEIQAALMKMHGTLDCKVILHPEKQALVAYLAVSDAFDGRSINIELARYLPDYMLPKYYALCSRLPLTANGKINVDALLSKSINIIHDSHFVLPETEEEELLARVWETTLDVTEVGRNDNYFSLGGDSIRMLSMIGNIRKEGFHLTLSTIYRYPKLADLAKQLTRQLPELLFESNVPCFSLVEGKLKEKYQTLYEDVYPLTKLQEGMIFHSDFNNASTLYMDVISCEVKGRLDVLGLRNILQGLTLAQPILRTRLLREESRYLQGLMIEPNVSLEVADLMGVSDHHGYLKTDLDVERNKKFNMEETVLWRVKIYQLTPASFVFSLICHHAILDGWSVALFFKEVFQNYNRFLKFESEAIYSHPGLAYSSYVKQELRCINSEKAADFWRQYLSGVSPCLAGDFGKRDIGESSFINKRAISIASSLSSCIKNLSWKLGVGLDIILLSVHLFTMSLTLGRCKIVSGLTANGRPEVESGSHMMGLFLNSVPLACEIDGTLSWEEWVHSIRYQKAEIQPYLSFPLSEMLKITGQRELFDVLFNFVDFHVFDALRQLDEISIKPSICYDDTNFNILVQAAIDPSTNHITVNIAYHTPVVSEDYASLYQTIFLTALEQFGNAPQQSLYNHCYEPYLSNYFPLEDWNHTAAVLPTSKGLFDLFLEQVDLNPDNMAIVNVDVSLTYRETLGLLIYWRNVILDHYKHIHDEDFPTDLFIAIVIPRSLESVIMMLAVVSLGATYIPLDPDHPQARMEYYINDSQASLILMNEEALEKHAWIGQVYADKVLLWRHDGCCQNDRFDMPSFKQVNDQHCAYMMYTSGSTGQPKGVLIDQLAIVRLVRNTNYINFLPADNVGHTSNVSFDVSTFEIWGALLNGATLVVIPQSILLDSQKLEEELKNKSINIMWLTARLFDQLVMNGSETLFSGLEYLMVGGDVLCKEWIAHLLKNRQGSPKHLLNGYGPTENTSFTTTYEIFEGALEYASIPIGKPIANTRVYVLDEECNVLPVGQVGELYAAGIGLARGYHNASDLISKKFIDRTLFLPASQSFIKERLYATGDLACWQADGNLLFFGRVDRTVKISGYQVNLDTAESVINSQPNIDACRILTLLKPSKHLVCYYLSDEVIDRKELVSNLRVVLPVYMIPQVFIRLSELPLTPNGKVNDKALPAPSEYSYGAQKTTKQTKAESMLENIWQSILHHNDFDIDDNFFDVGGSSLLAMQLHSKIKAELNRDLSISDVFRYPNIRSMSDYLQTQNQVMTELSEIREYGKNTNIMSVRNRMKNLMTTKD